MEENASSWRCATRHVDVYTSAGIPYKANLKFTVILASNYNYFQYGNLSRMDRYSR